MPCMSPIDTCLCIYIYMPVCTWQAVKSTLALWSPVLRGAMECGSWPELTLQVRGWVQPAVFVLGAEPTLVNVLRVNFVCTIGGGEAKWRGG